jgi:hypothetical protein
MAGNVEDLRRLLAEAVGLAFAEFDVDPGNAVPVGLRPDDRRSGRAL